MHPALDDRDRHVTNGPLHWRGVPLRGHVHRVEEDGDRYTVMVWEMGDAARGYMHGWVRLSIGSRWVPTEAVLLELDDAWDSLHRRAR